MKPVFGFFFLWWVLSAQPVGGTHAVELADTHRETEALGHKALHSRTGDKRMALAIVQHPGENLPAEFDWVSMSPLSQRLFTFALDTLEQPIHRCAMQRDRAEPSCLCSSHSLLHVMDNLSPDELSFLALVWCHSKWHGHHLHHLFFTLFRSVVAPGLLAPAASLLLALEELKEERYGLLSCPVAWQRPFLCQKIILTIC